jgi:polysaccharide biosynthesis protein PslG
MAFVHHGTIRAMMQHVMTRHKHLFSKHLAIALLLITSGCAAFGAPTPPPTPTAPQAVAQQSTAQNTPRPASAGTAAFGPVTGPGYEHPPGTVIPRPTNTPLSPNANTTFGAVIQVTQSGTTSAAPLPTLPNGTQTGAPTGSPNMATVSATSAFGAVVDPNYTPPPTRTPGPASPTTEVTLPPVVTPGPSPTPGPLLRPDLIGIQVHAYLTDEQWASMLDHAQALGVKWIKIQIQWKQLEPEPGNFTPLYMAHVLHVQRASLRGFRTMISIAKAPAWARPAGSADGPPSDPSALASFVRRMVTDIKPEFLDAVEIWNEPNLIREWTGVTMSGGEYMRYFDASYNAILDVQKAMPSALKPNHRVTVITAGPAPVITFPDGTTVDDRQWIRQLYAAGLGSYGDDVALGVHPYAWGNPPESMCCAASPGVFGWYEHPSFYLRNTLQDYRAIVLENGDDARKMWITEFGYATYDGLRRSDGSAGSVSAGSEWQNQINQQQQAEYLLRALNLLQQPPYYDYLGPTMVWNLNFATLPDFVDSGREEAGFSLLDNAGRPRPVYSKLAGAAKVQSP